ncbi:hypothetical protein [Aliikangiella coralliicola]|uniref:Uncharacterized protein n=1 Tax=Aliikangiella coralliicola TaxID=2592383 RepID=A0A545UCC3_9GAMM|nr:hypothetical protein [Aliikangiella coralliicola]TQV87073.1 hypothetical protein FLL46_14810 [Aliikangiella coralliicola]
MNPTLLLFGVQSVTRLARAGREALEQSARDEPAIFPALKAVDFNTENFVNGYFNKPENSKYVTGDGAVYAEYWDGFAVKLEPSSIDALYTAAVSLETAKGGSIYGTSTSAVLINQWDPKKGPISPWARVVLTAGDIVLDYVGNNPGIIGGGSGAVLVSAYASNLAKLIPDSGEFGSKEQFGQRILGVFLRAGLETLSENSSWVASEKHIQELITSSLQPVIDQFPDDLSGQLHWQAVTDAIVGPAAKVMLTTVANSPTTFLGSDFSGDKALGALTTALLTQAAETGLDEQFTQEGLLGLYQAALGVVAEKPQLFVGAGGRTQDQFAKDLLSGFATVLQNMQPPFDNELSTELVKVALSTVGQNVHRFADGSNAWEKTAADLVKTFTDSFSEIVGSGKPLDSVFSRPQLIELGRVLLTNISASPSMILESNNASLEGILVAITNAMKADEHLLLSGNDWIEIVAIASKEAAANPGRLFDLDADNPDDILAGQLITLVLNAASEAITTNKDKAVLFGNTLKEAIAIVLQSSSGKAKEALENLQQVQQLLQSLNALVAGNSGQFGSEEWLELFQSLLGKALEGQSEQGVLVAVMNAMNAVDDALLSGGDWMQIIEVAIQEAAANPGRLFNLDEANPDDILAGQLITLLLDAANETVTANGKDKAVLFGDTLKEAVSIVLRTTSGNALAAKEHITEIKQLVVSLNEFVATNNTQYGSKEWLRVFRVLMGGVLENKGVPPLVVDQVDDILRGGF